MKTSELTGAALDWAVCTAEGYTPVVNPVWNGSVRYGYYDSAIGHQIKNYCGAWEHGGPIIERESITVYPSARKSDDGPWEVESYSARSLFNGCEDIDVWVEGPTYLIAAMRCYCASKLGDEIDIPQELLIKENT